MSGGRARGVLADAARLLSRASPASRRVDDAAFAASPRVARSADSGTRRAFASDRGSSSPAPSSDVWRKAAGDAANVSVGSASDPAASPSAASPSARGGRRPRDHRASTSDASRSLACHRAVRASGASWPDILRAIASVADASPAPLRAAHYAAATRHLALALAAAPQEHRAACARHPSFRSNLLAPALAALSRPDVTLHHIQRLAHDLARIHAPERVPQDVVDALAAAMERRVSFDARTPAQAANAIAAVAATGRSPSPAGPGADFPRRCAETTIWLLKEQTTRNETNASSNASSNSSSNASSNASSDPSAPTSRRRSLLGSRASTTTAVAAALSAHARLADNVLANAATGDDASRGTRWTRRRRASADGIDDTGGDRIGGGGDARPRLSRRPTRRKPERERRSVMAPRELLDASAAALARAVDPSPSEAVDAVVAMARHGYKPAPDLDLASALAATLDRALAAAAAAAAEEEEETNGDERGTPKPTLKPRPRAKDADASSEASSGDGGNTSRPDDVGFYAFPFSGRSDASRSSSRSNVDTPGRSIAREASYAFGSDGSNEDEYEDEDEEDDAEYYDFAAERYYDFAEEEARWMRTAAPIAESDAATVPTTIPAETHDTTDAAATKSAAAADAAAAEVRTYDDGMDIASPRASLRASDGARLAWAYAEMGLLARDAAPREHIANVFAAVASALSSSSMDGGVAAMAARALAVAADVGALALEPNAAAARRTLERRLAEARTETETNAETETETNAETNAAFGHASDTSGTIRDTSGTGHALTPARASSFSSCWLEACSASETAVLASSAARLGLDASAVASLSAAAANRAEEFSNRELAAVARAFADSTAGCVAWWNAAAREVAARRGLARERPSVSNGLLWSLATSARAPPTPVAVLARATRAAVRNERFDAGAAVAALWCVARLAERRDESGARETSAGREGDDDGANAVDDAGAAGELARWVSKAAARVDADAPVLSPAERAAAVLAVESLGRGSRGRSAETTRGLTVDEDGRLRFAEEDGGE